ncbi:MAG TPA: hypothetical protein VL125_10965 [Pelobium sp.]|nr:hypothetical protein [Pelobium sp.]
MKDLYLLFFVLLVTIFACNHPKKISGDISYHSLTDSNKSKPLAKDSVSFSDKMWINLEEKALIDSILNNKEYMDFYEVRINGKLSLITDSLALYNLLGKPAIVEKPDFNDVCVSFYSSENYKYLRYGDFTKFELYGDTVAPASLEFLSNPKLFLTYRNLILNSNTSISEVEKVFPKAVKFKSKINDYEMGELLSVYLKTKNRNSLDDSWILFFKKGKLVKIDYFMPC